MTYRTRASTLRSRWFFLALLFAATPVGCSQPSQTESNSDQGSLPKFLATVDSAVQERIMAAREDLFNRLSGRLMQTLQEEGPAAAIEICSQEAPRFAQEVGSQHGLTIGRTSLKLRNPANGAPVWVRPIIANNPSEPQFIDLGNQHVGAILPIKMQATCLLCHGPSEMILDEVKAELAKFYPDDRATGFEEGDIRGWFWLDVPTQTESDL